MGEVPKVFISYSWSSLRHEERVIDLATRLMSHGVTALLDKWDLKEGQDKYKFMEQAVVDPDVDRVLLICDKKYADKADSREGGVGDETAIISPEIYGQASQDKFIPVIFEKDANGIPYRPAYIKSRIYIDLSDDDIYEKEYEKLLRNILSKPLYKKPQLGNIPEWLSDDKSDISPLRDIIKQMKGSTSKEIEKQNALIRRFNDAFIEVLANYAFEGTTGLNAKRIIEQIEKLKPIRDIYINFLDALILIDASFLDDKIADFFQNVYNSVISVDTTRTSHSESEFDHYRYLLWEMFICTVAYLLHYEKFSVIKGLVYRTYFLNRGSYSDEELPESFTFFRQYLRSIEQNNKSEDGTQKLSLSADMLVKREALPVITKSRIVEADVLLCQLSHIYATSSHAWFPYTYIYNQNSNILWKRLISRKYCERTMELYGAESIAALKEITIKYAYKRPVEYQQSLETVPSILTTIDADVIASKP